MINACHTWSSPRGHRLCARHRGGCLSIFHHSPPTGVVDHPAETYDVAYDDMVFDLVMHLHTQWESKKGQCRHNDRSRMERMRGPPASARPSYNRLSNMARLYDFGDTVQAADAWSAFATLQTRTPHGRKPAGPLPARPIVKPSRDTSTRTVPLKTNEALWHVGVCLA